MNLNTTMLNRIRTDRVADFLKQQLEKPFNANVISKQNYSMCQRKCHKASKPFQELKRNLSDNYAKEALTRNHHRLLFENFLQLQEGKEVDFFTNEAHFLKDHYIVDPFAENMKFCLLKPVEF